MDKVAAIQMTSTHLVDENLETAARLIEEAAKHDARLLVLPENVAIMGLNEFDKCQVKETFGQGKIQDFLAEQSRKHRVWIVAGTIPIACHDENRVRAASLVYNDEGVCVARYDKIHLFDVTISETEKYKESDFIQAGNEIVTVETPFGKLGLAVCYDIRFPELFRCLFNAGAEIIVLPSAFTVKTGNAHWDVLLRSRAIENFCYVIGAGQAGVHTNKRATYGNSLIAEPWGSVVSRLGSSDAGIAYAEIDLSKLHAIRQSIPVAQHQKIFFNVGALKYTNV